MRSLFSTLLACLLAQSAIAQTPAATPFPQAAPSGPQPAFLDPRLWDPNWVPRVFQLRYVDARWMEQLLFPYGAVVERQENLNSIAVRAPAAVIDSIAQLIKQMDIAANATKTVELTCFLILASPQAGSETMPPVLKPVVDQLRNLLAYHSYSVIDTIIGRSTAGKDINLRGTTAKASDNATWLSYELVARANTIGDGTDQTVRLDPVRLVGSVESSNPDFNPNVPNVPGARTLTTAINISTSLDLKKGQQVVVGKSSVRDHALILVISAKVE